MSQSDSAVTFPAAGAPVAVETKSQRRNIRSLVLGGSLVMLISMLLVNGFNFAYNVFMARILGPSEFGHINAAITILLIVSSVSLSFQLVCAKFVARNEAFGAKSAVVKSLLGKAWIASLIIAAILFIAQKPFAAYLNLPDHWILGLLALGVAVYAPLGVKRGAMQGLCFFPRLGGNFVVEAVTRFVVGVGLVLAGYGALGAVGAISAAVVMAYFLPPMPREVRVEAIPGEPASFAEAVQAIVFFIGQVIINNIDILLVKHFFPAEPAGIYAAIAQIGRLLYFVCWFGIVNAMFPVAASRQDQKKSEALGLPMLLVFAISCVFVLGAALFPHFIMGLIFGSKFINIGSLLALYAIATGLYSLSVVLIAYEMSRRIANTGWLQLVISGALFLVIGFFHQTLHEVIMVRIVLMVIMLFLVSFPFLRRVGRAPVEAT
ncbi:MAG TPA: oligosaccharide flippase family protein [Candidatus Angelobacter sp.]|jgi:O-antigen/teichoic acid export membrane protein|nr:oligosaccharide flippase family protein [Candidatus Angelobacter sp.]